MTGGVHVPETTTCRFIKSLGVPAAQRGAPMLERG